MAIFLSRAPFPSAVDADNAPIVARYALPPTELGNATPSISVSLANPATVAAASTDPKKNSSPEPWATLVSAGIFVVSLAFTVLVLFGTEDRGPTYKPVEGLGVFALFYVVAQAAERLVEMALPYVDRRKGGKAELEAERDQKVVDGTLGETSDDKKAPEKSAADAQAEVDQARANRTALVFACTAALGMLLCGYLEADFLRSLGVTFASGRPGALDEVISMAVTGLVVGGGSKAIHDTISNISKASEQKSTPTQTGGTQ